MLKFYFSLIKMYQQLFLLTVIFVIGVHLDQAAEDKFNKAAAKCKAKFPSQKDTVLDDACNNGTSAKDANCMLKCLGEESGFLGADGKLIVDEFKDGGAKLDQALPKCAAIIKSDPCDTAYEQWKCICPAMEVEVIEKKST